MNDTELMLKLKENYLRDLQKKEFDKFERARIVRSLLEDTGLTQREFAKRFGLSHSTVQDWLIFKEERKNEYEKLVEQGFTQTAIYRKMRNKNVDIVAVDVWGTDVSTNAVRLRRTTLDYTKNTVGILEKAVNDINQLIVHINLLDKKRKEVRG